jgi:hypothetical protein
MQEDLNSGVDLERQLREADLSDQMRRFDRMKKDFERGIDIEEELSRFERMQRYFDSYYNP